MEVWLTTRENSTLPDVGRGVVSGTDFCTLLPPILLKRQNIKFEKGKKLDEQ